VARRVPTRPVDLDTLAICRERPIRRPVGRPRRELPHPVHRNDPARVPARSPRMLPAGPHPHRRTRRDHRGPRRPPRASHPGTRDCPGHLADPARRHHRNPDRHLLRRHQHRDTVHPATAVPGSSPSLRATRLRRRSTTTGQTPSPDPGCVITPIRHEASAAKQPSTASSSTPATGTKSP